MSQLQIHFSWFQRTNLLETSVAQEITLPRLQLRWRHSSWGLNVPRVKFATVVPFIILNGNLTPPRLPLFPMTSSLTPPSPFPLRSILPTGFPSFLSLSFDRSLEFPTLFFCLFLAKAVTAGRSPLWFAVMVNLTCRLDLGSFKKS